MRFCRSLLAVVFLAFPCALFAQVGNASLTGLIDDPSKAVIRNVSVTAINTQTGVKTQTFTNGAGQYVLASLMPGTYRMEVDKQGFKGIIEADLVLHTQDVLQINFHMAVGSMSETVTVNSEATNVNPAVSMTVSREFVENMPLNGRSFQDLIQLAPGTVSNQNGYYSIDGQRTDSNSYTVDGVSANIGTVTGNGAGVDYGMSGNSPPLSALGTTQGLASIDSLQEFKIQTSGYTAEYGRYPGGQVEFTTRSGSNDIHGSLFEYLRNTVFDANSFASNYYGYPKTAERQNDFGGTIGGPLIVPKLYNGKSKTFYFFSYEGLRLFLPAFESEYVPTQAFRQWSSPYTQPYLNVAPLPSANSPGNQDGCTVPDPTTGQPTACDALFTYGYSNPSSLDNISIRVDHTLSNHFHAFIRYSDTPSSASSGAESFSSSLINSHTWTAGVTFGLARSLIGDLRFNYSHEGAEGISDLKSIGGSIIPSRNLFIPAAYDGPYAYTNYYLYVPNTSLYYFYKLGGYGTGQHQYQVVNDLAWSIGSHTVKLGEDWRRLTPITISQPYGTSIQVDSLSDLQQGFATQLYTFATASGEPVFNNLSLYTQDHWKIKPSLSLDYGLRWEFNPPPGPSNGRYPVALTSSDLATAQLRPLGSSPYKTSYNHFAPRFGFAWDAIRGGKLALTVRGGFGIFYDTGQSAIGYAYSGGFPFSAQRPAQNEVPLPFSDASLAPPSLSASLTPPYPYLHLVTSPNLTLPYTEQWNISIDKAVSAKNTLTASYVGNNGKKLLFSQSYGSAPEGNESFAGGLTLTSNASQSSYNALQIQDVGRVATGLDIIVSFTLAHALDNASNENTSYVPTWGNSDNDLRRVLNVALNYQTHSIAADRWTRVLSNGWLIANRFSTQSGYPLNIVQDNVILPSGASAQYFPDLIPSVPIYLHGRAADIGARPVPGGWRINNQAFALVPTDADGNPIRQGTLGRNYLRNPSFYALNTALQRTFPIYERLRVNFRAEAFNILNHPNLANPDNYLPDATFGQLASGTTTIGSSNALYAMGAARSLQLSLHLQF